ncbi:MAG: hypothetical protein AB8B56_04405 [Crocinitomicaceae bacterium]
MNAIKNLRLSFLQISSMFMLMFVVLSCEPTETKEDTSTCETNLTDIEGEYECSGECVVTKDGARSVVIVSSETDMIEQYSDSSAHIYQVKIEGADNFRELEIGTLSGNELYTATAEVSDSTYPVLEKYIFDTDENGKVTGFTKIVRNPDHENFKSCIIYGKKVSE